MKLVLLQLNPYLHLGVCSLASVVKAAGHEFELIIVNLEKNVMQALASSRPDIVGFSITTGLHNWALAQAREIKAAFPSIPIILGGPHATFYPEVINEEPIDMVCRGEGEIAVVELLNRMAVRADISMVPNLWIKQNGKVVKNAPAPLVENLDLLPFPDRSILDKYPLMHRLQRNISTLMMASRGCPFHCTFCFNDTLKSFYHGKGTYCRWRSVGNVIEEIERMRADYHVEKVIFTDDLFTMRRAWILDFCETYARKINLPFYCIIRADHVDEKIVASLSRAGCVFVTLGVETGNDHLRNVILRKRMTTEQIREAAKLVKRHGMWLQTLNILGIPGETVEEALETLRLNIEIGADHAWCSLLQPYPRTAIMTYCLEQGYLDEDYSLENVRKSYFLDSPLKMEQIRQIENLQKFFQIAVRWPWLLPAVRRLIQWQPNALFDVIFKLSYAYFLHAGKKDPLRDSLIFALKTRYF